MKRKTRTEEIQEQIDALQEKARKLQSMGEDKWPNETVMFFQKQFQPFNTIYDFVALKAANLWWLTGSMFNYRGKTWEELVEFIVLNNNVEPEVWVVSEWRQL